MFSSSLRLFRHELSCSSTRFKSELAAGSIAGSSTVRVSPAQILKDAASTHRRRVTDSSHSSSRSSDNISLSPKSIRKEESDTDLLSQDRETPVAYLKHRAAMKSSFPSGWNPPRKLSREAMAGLRALHASNPALFNTPMLADKFRISPEAVRRILKAKWVPKGEERARMVRKERERRAEWIRRSRDAEGERKAVGKWARDAVEKDERELKKKDGLMLR